MNRLSEPTPELLGMSELSGWTCCSHFHPVDIFFCPVCHRERPEWAALEVAPQRVAASEQRKARKAAA